MESNQLYVIIFFFIIINLISTLSYSVKIVAIRTQKVSITYSIFNILVLFSRISNGFLAPILANFVEKMLINNTQVDISIFQLIVFSSFIATIIGIILIPTFQRLLSIAVIKFSEQKSILKVITSIFTQNGFSILKNNITLPQKSNFILSNLKTDFPLKFFLLNIFAVSIITCGVIASVYAGTLNSNFRSTANNLSSVINGFATILMFLIIDPYLSILTDEVILGKFSEAKFRLFVKIMLIARLLGTLLSIFLLRPFAEIIIYIASIM